MHDIANFGSSLEDGTSALRRELPGRTEKGEALEWVVKDRNTFEIRRVKATSRGARNHHE
jgi:hypothetical protein